MPTAVVNDEGGFLYYEDSGIPEGTVNYTTIFLIHGLVFHSGEDTPYSFFLNAILKGCLSWLL